MQRRIRQTAVRRAGNARTGEVKVIGAAGSEGKLLCETKLCCQPGYLCRDAATRCVELAIAATPHKVAACISIGAGQTIGGRCGKAPAVFHNDLDILRAAAQFTAAKVKGNDFQPVRTHRIRVQDFKDRAKTEARVGGHSIVAVPVAGRTVPAKCSVLLRITRSILPPRIYYAPVFDISVILVQYPVPFVALGRAALGITRACTIASHGRRTQRIVHATGSVAFAENQTRIVQGIPTCLMRYGIVCHEQAMDIFVLLCILLGGCHL